MDDLITLTYLLAASLFIIGMKKLASPATARGGNQLSAVGMLLAVIATLFVSKLVTIPEMILGLVVGAAIGAYLAKRVEMTAMPELVAAFNGFGGGASALVAASETVKNLHPETVAAAATHAAAVQTMDGGLLLTIGLSVLIGCVTFSGSFIAYGKLGGSISGNPVSFPGMRLLTMLLGIGVIVGIGAGIAGSVSFAETVNGDLIIWSLIGVAIVSLILGVLLVIPIGGADMPVVVALLNSYSGLAAAATGFVLQNEALIVSGALVGASGIILTKIMCEAMNRSLFNVLLGGFGQEADLTSSGPADAGDKTYKQITPDDAAILLSYADKVVIVPGYGMAVAQAQHVVRELGDLLQDKGVDIKYAVHPVAGRMPGHMNVLLAEANVPYDQLFDMDDINPDFETTDVVLVIGANDVVNPAARTDKSSPIYGMPILDVDHAHNVIILKRSMRPGYAGVDNELFYNARTSMLFGDAKDSISTLVSEVKSL
ncbi:MAG: NAD(P)(+) transhydrogenase (Re/Si-specific) subunit beta [Rhodothermales bacterium]|jgi:NAD(P) transhydrogenase subunit beta